MSKKTKTIPAQYTNNFRELIAAGDSRLSTNTCSTTTLINLHDHCIHPGEYEIREDGEVWIRGKWIYIGRSSRVGIPQSRWRNEHTKGTREESIAKYEADILANPELLARLQALKRKTPATKDSDCLTSLDASPLHAGKPSRENIRKEKHFFVAEALWHLARSDISVRDADILRLAATITTVKVSISEECTTLLVKHVAIGAIMLTIGFLALHWKSLRTEKAAAARYRKRNDHSVARAKIAYLRPDIFDDAHEFMPHHEWLRLRKNPL